VVFVSAIVVYSLFWWLIFFISLPIGVSLPSADSMVEGQAHSAPVHHNLKKKVLYSTIIAVVPTLAVVWAIESGLWSLESWLGVESWKLKH
jgi:predicted secreted protein